MKLNIICFIYTFLCFYSLILVTPFFKSSTIASYSASDKLYLLNNKKATDNEINDIKVNLSHILIDSLDDAKVNLTPVIDSILEIFFKIPIY